MDRICISSSNITDHSDGQQTVERDSRQQAVGRPADSKMGSGQQDGQGADGQIVSCKQMHLISDGCALCGGHLFMKEV